MKTSDPTPEKKRKVGYKLKMAMLDVIERKRLTDRVDYRAIAIRHNCTVVTLKTTYKWWVRGCIDMGEVVTAADKQLDARLTHEKALELTRRYKNLILKGLEGLIFEAEDAMSKGDIMAWKKLGLGSVLAELKNVSLVQAVHERGYASVLEDAMAQSRAAEKKIEGHIVDIPSETKILHINDEEKALAALHGRLSEPAPAAFPQQNAG